MPAISQAFRCFDEVAKRGSVRKAAEALHLTAPAVNQQILNLEGLVGVPLFDRIPAGLRLNSAGHVMLAAVRRSQREFDNGLLQIEDEISLKSGSVSIGAPHATAELLLPKVIRTIQQRHPGIKVKVRASHGEDLLRWLAEGDIDAAYCLRRLMPPGLQEGPVLPQRLGVVTGPDHPLVQRHGTLRIRDCLDHPLILLSPQMELRIALDIAEPALSTTGIVQVETSSVHMVKRLVADGLSVGFLLADNVVEEVDLGHLVWTPLEDPGSRLQSCVYTRAGYAPPPAVSALLRELELTIQSVQARVDQPRTLDLQSMAI